jgi:hypothetical protein
MYFLLCNFLALFYYAESDSVFSVQYNDNVKVKNFSDWLNNFNIDIKDNYHFGHIFINWLNNDKFIEITNSKNLSYTVGHNSFSGYNLEEFGLLYQAQRFFVLI